MVKTYKKKQKSKKKIICPKHKIEMIGSPIIRGWNFFVCSICVEEEKQEEDKKMLKELKEENIENIKKKQKSR